MDITDRILEGYTAESIAHRSAASRGVTARTKHPHAALMFAKFVANQSDRLGRASADFIDFDHATNFRTFVACLTRNLDPAVQVRPGGIVRPDEHVREMYFLQRMEEENLHQEACLRHGLRTCHYDMEGDSFELRLTKRRRRSALGLLDSLAQADLLEITYKEKHRNRTFTDDDVFFALASSSEHLQFVEKADPASWQAFESAMGCTSTTLASFAGFLVFLEFAAYEAKHGLWYDLAFLERLRSVFLAGFPDVALSEKQLTYMMGAFCLTPDKAAEWALPVPFVRFRENYLRYHGFIHVMNPVMSLMTIAIRLHEDAWSRTVGSTLSKAADTIRDSLPAYDNILISVRRKIGSEGDIDLAAYDTATGHMLICEIKTVYDKHRTILQMQRFEDAKMNLSRAVRQLRQAEAALTSGKVDMQVLFGKNLVAPRKVTSLILNWLDPVDLTMGTSDEDILCLNFATFRFLLDQSGGALDEMVRAAFELRNIWCVSELRPIDLQIELPTRIQAQLPVIDSRGDLGRLELSDLTLSQLEHLESLPDGWRNDSDMSQVIVSYLNDTVEYMSGSVR